MKTMKLLAPLLALALAACATTKYPHVELEAAPTVADDFDARAAYYKKHAANSYNGSSVLLHGGERVYYPEDLLPAVDPDSPTARAIERHVEARANLEEKAPPLMIPAAVGTLGGLALMTLSPIALAIEGDAGETIGFGGMILGGVAMTAGLGFAMAAPFILGEDERALAESTETVLRTYPQSLADRVGVQPDANGVLVDLATKPEGARKAEKSDGTHAL